MSRLKEKYNKEIVKAMVEKFGYSSSMAVPKIVKIVVSSGLGEAKIDTKIIDQMKKDLAEVTGQVPKVCAAKKSVAGFKLREGLNIGLVVTLRKERMYEFLDRLVSIALPRVKDFRGIPRTSFDGKGNLNIGVKEHVVFPEIGHREGVRAHGLGIAIFTSTQSDAEAMYLLELFGMPFVKEKK